MNREHDFLFELRFRLSSGPLVIRAFEGPFQYPSHTRIDCELVQDGKTIFKRGDTWCGIPCNHSIDGVYARELVVSTLSIKPGDTDSDYFDSYTADQLRWVEANREELDMLKQDRYCDPETGGVRRVKR